MIIPTTAGHAGPGIRYTIRFTIDTVPQIEGIDDSMIRRHAFTAIIPCRWEIASGIRVTEITIVTIDNRGIGRRRQRCIGWGCRRCVS